MITIIAELYDVLRQAGVADETEGGGACGHWFRTRGDEIGYHRSAC
jgi:hypothetical protein